MLKWLVPFSAFISIIWLNYNTLYDADSPSGFSPMIATLLFVTLICLVVGIILAFVVAFIILMLIAGGILTLSAVVGFYYRSFSKGFTTFTILGCIVFSSLLSAASLALANSLIHWTTPEMALLLGGCAGFFSGILLGLLIVYLAKKLGSIIKQWLQIR